MQHSALVNVHHEAMKISLFIILLAFLFYPATARAQVVVIGHKSVPEKKLSQKELLEIYTLNQSHWDDGSRITVVDLKKNSDTRSAFYRHIDIEEEDLRRIWLKKQFTGKALPPRILDSEDAVVEAVASTPGAVGYVNQSSLKNTKDVKILAKVR